MSFRVPPCVASHRHKLVSAAIDRCHLIYNNRDHLDAPVKDAHGNVVLPALPFLLQGMDEEESGDPRILSRRRADFLQGFLSALLVAISSVSYRSKAILSRRHAKRGEDPFMSLREWEELAVLVPEGGYAKSKRTRTLADGSKAEVEVEEAGDRIERYTRLMREMGLLHESKQNREKLADGRHRSAGAAIKRIVWKALYAFGGRFAQIARAVQRHVREKLAQERKHDAEVDEKIREQFDEQERRRALYEEGDDGGAELEAAEPRRAPGAPDPTIMDDVHDAHPTWTPPQIMDEARNIEARLRAETPDTS